MDVNKYIEIFIEEAKEHLQNLNQNLLQLEKNPDDIVVLNEIFRIAHTLKGMAGTMGFSKMATLTHDMEDVLQAIKNGEIKVNSDLVDILFKCLDALEAYLNSIIERGEEGNYYSEHIISMLRKIAETKTIVSGSSEKRMEADSYKKAEEPKVIPKFPLNEYEQRLINKALQEGMNVFEITVVLNKGCLLKSARVFLIFQGLEKHGEIIKSIPRVEDLEEEKFDLEFTVIMITKESEEFLRDKLNTISEIDKIIITPLSIMQEKISTAYNRRVVEEETTAGLMQETITLQGRDSEIYGGDYRDERMMDDSQTNQGLKQGKMSRTVRVDINRLDALMNLVSELIIIKTRLEGLDDINRTQNYNETVEYLERITTSLHDAVMKVRMVPVEMVFNRFPRMVRDLSKSAGKKVNLIITGEDTELDRTVIDEIGDPLVHLLRNAVDHGIEEPEKRKAAGKNVVGTVYLRAYQEGNNVVIEVEDDGAGINIEKVKKKAIELGLVEKSNVNTLSKNDIINFLFRPSFSTADKVTNISGRGVGLDVVKTKIEMLGGNIGVETEVGKGSKFIIRLPLTLAIIQALLVLIGEEKFAIPLGSIQEIININPQEIKTVQKQEVIVLRKNVIPIIRLDKVLEVPNPKMNSKQVTVVVVKKGDKLSGFVVDGLLGQQEIVIKSLGRLLMGIKTIAGATILGDGQVALILDVNSLA